MIYTKILVTTVVLLCISVIAVPMVVSHQEVPSPLRLLSWSIDKRHHSDYPELFELIYKPLDIKIRGASDSITLNGYTQEDVNRTITAPEILERLGYDPLTDSITKIVTWDNLPDIPFNRSSYCNSTSFSSFSTSRPLSFGASSISP